MLRRTGLVGALALAVVVSAPAATVASQVDAVGAISKKSFIKKGDALCAESDAELDALVEQHFGGLAEDESPTVEQIEAYAADFEPVVRELLEDLRELPTPKGDKKRVEKIFDLVEDSVDTVADDPTILFGDVNPFAKADKAAQKYGFKVCGNN